MFSFTTHLPLLLSLLSLLTTSTAQDWIASELSQVNSYQYVRFTECTSFISTCQPTASSCASYICAECTGLGAKPLNSCCAGPDPVSCFRSLKGVAASASTTSVDVVSDSSVVVTATSETITAAGTGTATTATGASVTAASTAVTSASATIATTAASNLAGGIIEAYSGHAFGVFGVIVAVFAYVL